MNDHYKKFLVNNLLVSAVLVVLGWALFSGILSVYYQSMYPLLIVFALLNNLTLFFFVTRKNQSQSKTIRIVVAGFAIKFFSYIVITLLFFLIEKNFNLRVGYIAALFFVYMIYTIVEVISLTKFFKTGNISS
jgi:hypothetical protein